MTPSLIDELEDALASKTEERRMAALWRITDLFIAGADNYSEDHVTLFDDVIQRLAATIEKNARAKLSSRLARVPNAPPGVIRSLASDHDIRVAQPVLRHSPRLDDGYLVATAATHSQQHLLAIAQRQALSEAVTDLLVERGDRDVVRSVAQNSGARFSSAAFRTLVERSVGDEVLAVHVGTRRDLPRQHLLKLVERASAAVRQKLAAADPAAAGAIRDVIAEIDGSIRAASRRASHRLCGGAHASRGAASLRTARRGAGLRLRRRAQVRGDRGRALAADRRADRPGRARDARRQSRHGGHPRQGRGLLLEHRAMHPAARHQPRALGAGSRSRVVGLLAPETLDRAQHHRVLRCAPPGNRDMPVQAAS